MSSSLLRGLAVAPAILVGVGSLSVANAQEASSIEEKPAVLSSASTFATSDVVAARAQILKETNRVRAEAGLPPLKLSNVLNSVAQGCSQQQAAQGYMAHCDNFASKFPQGWITASENVAAGYSVGQVTTGWRNSPGHYRNMTDPKATHIGIGIAYGADGTPYYTQNFAGYAEGVLPASDNVNTPAQPTTPTAPVNPTKPVTPAKPSTPAKPVTPPAPEVPADDSWTTPANWSIPAEWSIPANWTDHDSWDNWVGADNWTTPTAWDNFTPCGSFPASDYGWYSNQATQSWTSF
ncbi:CAP domain-containing protein [Rothia sp. ND6WE1A]|uniref:CAP domain-containing protein n=1 Tax=Rothia sp. ND6WE1A TaxID=1848190 RepID=UPI00082A952F|nr:CAP domain-containing protein [Rothia sp. ND6WE1A]